MPWAVPPPPDAGYSEGGPGTPLPVFLGQGFMNDVRQITAGSGSTASYTFAGLSPMATYQVSATWTGGAGRASDAPYTVIGALGGNLTIDVNQQAAPGDFTEGGKQFDVIAIVPARR